MKTTLFIFHFILIALFSQAQSFQIDVVTENSSKILLSTSKIIEENNKFCTFYNLWPDTNHSELHYIEINATSGNIITDSIIFRDSFPARSYVSLKTSDNHYVFVNQNYNNKDKENNGKIILTDSLFNVLDESQLPLQGDSGIWDIPGIYEDSHTNLIFMWRQYNDTSIKPFRTHYFKTNLYLDSLNLLSIPYLTYNNLIDDTVLNTYVVNPWILDNTDTNIVMFYHYDFTLDTFIKWPNYLQIPPITSQNNYLRLSSTRFVYSSQTIQGSGDLYRGMGVYLYGDNLHLLTYKSLGAALNSSPSEGFSLSKIDNKSFYFSGVTNWRVAMEGYNDTCSIVLYKLDTNLNVIWTRYYNENILHNPHYSMTTLDKGCLIYGALYSHTGFFFLKVDSMGNLLWSHGLDVQEKVALVYPNPVSEVLYVDNGLGSGVNADLQLYDINGRQVLIKPLSPQQNSIDVSGLPQGIYFYRIADDKRVYQSGKILKQ